MKRPPRSGARNQPRVDPPPSKPAAGTLGWVVETVGRRVRVRDESGDRVCFLSGQRAVIGDRVSWVEAQGEGGKLTQVLPRETVLARRDHKGQEQILAANLTGVIIVDTPVSPTLAPSILDRYLVASAAGGLQAIVAINKVDLGIPPEAAIEIDARRQVGVRVLHTSTRSEAGLSELTAAIQGGSWAVVGRSGVGKTSLVARLVPEVEVGPVGALSEYWGMGTHTTTRSVWFDLPGGGSIVDSPGIRSFAPAGIDADTLRSHFPGIEGLACQFRDCLHRLGEDGCAAETRVPAPLLASYRTLLTEVVEIDAGVRRGRGEWAKRR